LVKLRGISLSRIRGIDSPNLGFGKKLLKLKLGKWMAVQITLGFVATAASEVFELTLGFHPLGYRRHVEGMREVDDGSDESATSPVCRQATDKIRSIFRLSIGSSDNRFREE